MGTGPMPLLRVLSLKVVEGLCKVISVLALTHARTSKSHPFSYKEHLDESVKILSLLACLQ